MSCQKKTMKSSLKKRKKKKLFGLLSCRFPLQRDFCFWLQIGSFFETTRSIFRRKRFRNTLQNNNLSHSVTKTTILSHQKDYSNNLSSYCFRSLYNHLLNEQSTVKQNAGRDVTSQQLMNVQYETDVKQPINLGHCHL